MRKSTIVFHGIRIPPYVRCPGIVTSRRGLAATGFTETHQGKPGAERPDHFEDHHRRENHGRHGRGEAVVALLDGEGQTHGEARLGDQPKPKKMLHVWLQPEPSRTGDGTAELSNRPATHVDEPDGSHRRDEREVRSAPAMTKKMA